MYRVMIADDEPIMRKALVTLTDWKSLNCEVVYSAGNGDEVLDNLDNTSPDIIITDIKMPRKTGLEIAKYISEKSLPIKVILLTAYADFSFAKAALQYGVVDYITKTGAFDEIIAAVCKAQKMIREERRELFQEDLEALMESFFKSILDGSLYDPPEILSKAQAYSMSNRNYLLLLLRFDLSTFEGPEQKTKIYHSLINFFTMAFHGQSPHILSLGRELFGVALGDVEANYRGSILKCCEDILDVAENFMKLRVLIGVSQRMESICDLPEARLQAENAILESFLQPDKKLHFFEPSAEKEHRGKEERALLNEIIHAVQKGESDEAIRFFQDYLSRQTACDASAATVKADGIYLLDRCQSCLHEYDSSLSELCGRDRDLPSQVQACFYVETFRNILEEALRETANLIAHTVKRKNNIVYDCEQYIAEHMEGPISVSDLAEKIGVSLSYLSRIFKEKTGNTIIDTINRKKLERAKTLLLETDLKIYEIADRLGFENTTYFSHFFKKYVQMSPVEYKRTIEKQS